MRRVLFLRDGETRSTCRDPGHLQVILKRGQRLSGPRLQRFIIALFDIGAEAIHRLAVGCDLLLAILADRASPLRLFSFSSIFFCDFDIAEGS